MPDLPVTAPETFYERVTRRNFVVMAGWGIFAAYIAAAVGALNRYLFPNILYEPATKFHVGRPADYAPNSISEKWLKDFRIWVVHDGHGLYALWARCTHLGCTPRWFGSENRFRCPCHGSNYNRKGEVIAGPAPRPLFRCKIWLEDGEIVVDRGVGVIKSTLNDAIRGAAPYYLKVA